MLSTLTSVLSPRACSRLTTSLDVFFTMSQDYAGTPQPNPSRSSRVLFDPVPEVWSPGSLVHLQLSVNPDGRVLVRLHTADAAAAMDLEGIRLELSGRNEVGRRSLWLSLTLSPRLCLTAACILAARYRKKRPARATLSSTDSLR